MVLRALTPKLTYMPISQELDVRLVWKILAQHYSLTGTFTQNFSSIDTVGGAGTFPTSSFHAMKDGRGHGKNGASFGVCGSLRSFGTICAKSSSKMLWMNILIQYFLSWKTFEPSSAWTYHYPPKAPAHIIYPHPPNGFTTGWLFL